jgi:hypothetical protein
VSGAGSIRRLLKPRLLSTLYTPCNRGPPHVGVNEQHPLIDFRDRQCSGY